MILIIALSIALLAGLSIAAITSAVVHGLLALLIPGASIWLSVYIGAAVMLAWMVFVGILIYTDMKDKDL